ncbi:MAG: RsmB/NOP family class I SAM-dependent RNA methyltransferase [Candidatus Roizmanbacteria bacterium]
MLYRLPEDFLLKLRLLYPENIVKRALDSFQSIKNTTIRINTIKTTCEEIRKILSDLSIHFEPVSWLSDALLLPQLSSREVTEFEIYKEGKIYIQNLSSMIPPIILDPQENESILDLASAPGSKTSHIASLMKNTGEIVANDISYVRIQKMKRILNQLGVTNVKIMSKPGELVWQSYQNYFDKVLLDAPCSMEGLFNTNKVETIDHWSLKKVKRLAKQQSWLLRSAISATKPGGTIIYSTCTISPEENEGVIDWILEKERGKIELEQIIIVGLDLYNGITHWNNKIYNPEVTKTVRIIPSPTMEGFFIAKIKKLNIT